MASTKARQCSQQSDTESLEAILKLATEWYLGHPDPDPDAWGEAKSAMTKPHKRAINDFCEGAFDFIHEESRQSRSTGDV